MLVPKSAFAARKIADRASSRYALGGIEFSRDGSGKPFATATDGRCLVALTWHEADAANYPAPAGIDAAPRENGAAFILPYAACVAAAKIKISNRV